MMTGTTSVAMWWGESDPEQVSLFLGSRTVIEQVVKTGQAVVATDATLDDRFTGQPSVILQNLRSIIAVPVVTNDQVIGPVYVDNPFRASRFDETAQVSLPSLSDV